MKNPAGNRTRVLTIMVKRLTSETLRSVLSPLRTQLLAYRNSETANKRKSDWLQNSIKSTKTAMVQLQWKSCSNFSTIRYALSLIPYRAEAQVDSILRSRRCCLSKLTKTEMGEYPCKQIDAHSVGKSSRFTLWTSSSSCASD